MSLYGVTTSMFTQEDKRSMRSILPGRLFVFTVHGI